jgi:hypothetical protein
MTDAQVKEKINEGNDLIKEPGAAAVVAARERLRAAEITFEKAKADYKAAKTPAGKELALDAVNEANEAFRRAEVLLDDAKFNVNAGLVSPKSAKEQAEEAIEDAVSIVAKPGAETFEADFERAAYERGRGIADEGNVATVYSTSTQEESNPAVQEAINDGRFSEAIERLAVDSNNPLIR